MKQSDTGSRTITHGPLLTTNCSEAGVLDLMRGEGSRRILMSVEDGHLRQLATEEELSSVTEQGVLPLLHGADFQTLSLTMQYGKLVGARRRRPIKIPT